MAICEMSSGRDPSFLRYSGAQADPEASGAVADPAGVVYWRFLGLTGRTEQRFQTGRQ